MRHSCTFLFVILMAVSPVLGLDVPEDAEAFIGRWNIEIRGMKDTFRTGWLKITSVDGELGGALVWKWGSVVPIRSVTVESGELRFFRGRNSANSFRAKLVDGELRGLAKMRGGGEFEFVGRRATEMCDVAGTWKVDLAERAEDRRSTLVFETKGGKITGKAVDPEGIRYAVRDASLDGYTLTFKVVPEEPDAALRVIRCEIRGDRLLGQVEVTPADETGKKTFQIRGERERAWGEPVALLKENSLEGWGPRDPGRKFGWKVKDGVLENSPPDVDIMSEARFRDFRLQLEYKVDPGSNSGIYLRGRYELQILGDEGTRDHGNMAVYSRLSPKTNPIRLGEWNSLDVTFIGRWLTVKLNGETVYDNQYLEGTTGGAWDEKESEPGPLLLQGDHGKVQFRNIVVTPVKS